MQLPKRGFATRADGTVYWAWEDNAFGTFSSIPPLLTNMDGSSFFRSRSDDTVIDLDDCGLTPFDLTDLHKYLSGTRCRKQLDGSYQLTLVMEDGTEIDHPVLSVLNFRRQSKGLKPIKGVVQFVPAPVDTAQTGV